MLFVPRQIRQATPEPSNTEAPHPGGPPVEPLHDYRDKSAWILLGEPGAGKSEAFRHESGETGGVCLTVAEFIHLPPPTLARGQVLFLDGLDEVRAGGGEESTLLKVRARLRELGRPHFRLSCRAADWYGSSDSDALKAESPDGNLGVLLLEPLTDDDRQALLTENHGIEDPKAFIREAERRGLSELLGNPQTLDLLANALAPGWPSSREETYLQACEKLATEDNKIHRDLQRGHAPNTDQLLAAAGQLCAALLFADKSGIALDPERADERYPSLDDYAPTSRETAIASLGSKLFRPASEERMEPTHRSVAEYLASRWLAKQIDRHTLPLGRVLKLLLGADGRTVAGLRGLFAWLALHCRTASDRLIDADAMTVLAYGDARPFPLERKRRLLRALRAESERFAQAHQRNYSFYGVGSLADPALIGEFQATLEAPERDAAHQGHVDLLLDALSQGEVMPQLQDSLRDAIEDTTRWLGVRYGALAAWLRTLESPQPALTLLNGIADGDIQDGNDDLAGRLLEHLYPNAITPAQIFRYYHPKKQNNFLGSFSWFWTHEFIQRTPADDLPFLLDHLASNPMEFGTNRHDSMLSGMVGRLLVRGLEVHGDRIEVGRLFDWLGVGSDMDRVRARRREEREWIANWITARPDRYKRLILHCVRISGPDKNLRFECEYRLEKRFSGARPPDDLGVWHLHQAERGEEPHVQFHITASLNALAYQRGDAGLCLEHLEDWAERHPMLSDWFASSMVSLIPEERWRDIEDEAERKRQQEDDRRERSREISKHLLEVRNGTAYPALLNELASVWKDHFSDIPGDNVEERFDSYCDQGPTVMEAARIAFLSCPDRKDLPTVDEIIKAARAREEYLLHLPCLLGMELRSDEGSSELAELPDDTLATMIAFSLSSTVDEPPTWFETLVRDRPSLVAGVLVRLNRAALRARMATHGLYLLHTDDNWRQVAEQSVPALLGGFPTRAKSDQLFHLEGLLKAALKYRMVSLSELVASKMALRSMDIGQRIYWLCTGLLLDPAGYESRLWETVGASRKRLNHLSSFLGNRDLGPHFELSPETAGRLIKRLLPHAEFKRPRPGRVYRPTAPMQWADHIHSLISGLARSTTDEAGHVLKQLLLDPTIDPIRTTLQEAQYQWRSQRRERLFRFPSLKEVARVLANAAPANVADLTALTLDHLDEIATELRNANDDGFRAFWNLKAGQPTSPREENVGRDAILTRLRARMNHHGIDCQPEADYARDKRADIRVSFQNTMDLPIEFKRDTNPELWTGLRDQLINQYARAPGARDHGIYVVFWFGIGCLPPSADGDERPGSPDALKARLEAALSPEERQQVFVRVLDVSWPRPQQGGGTD